MLLGKIMTLFGWCTTATVVCGKNWSRLVLISSGSLASKCTASVVLTDGKKSLSVIRTEVMSIHPQVCRKPKSSKIDSCLMYNYLPHSTT